MEIDVREADSRLSELIDRAVAGEDVIITEFGRPVARLVRFDGDAPELGSARGEVVLPDGWEAPMSDREVEDLFGG